MNIGTRCSSLDAFVATYSRYVIGETLFVVSREPRPLGVTSPFVFRLADGTPALCGICEITQLWTDDKNPYKRPGIWLSIRRLNSDSFPVLLRMQDAQNAESRAGLIADVKAKIALEAKLAKDWDQETEARPPAMMTDIISQMARTQGGAEILPANPLSHIDDEALEDMLGFALTVQTGPFEPASDDQLFEDTPLPRVLARGESPFPPSAATAAQAAASQAAAASPAPAAASTHASIGDAAAAAAAASASPAAAAASAAVTVLRPAAAAGSSTSRPASPGATASPPPAPASAKPSPPPVPARPAAAAGPPKVQIPPIRPMATPPTGTPIVSSSVALPGLPPVASLPPAAATNGTSNAAASVKSPADSATKQGAAAPSAARPTLSGREHRTEMMVPLVVAPMPESAAATSTRAARDTMTGGDVDADADVDAATTDSTLAEASPVKPTIGAPGAAGDVLTASDSTDSPVASKPDAPSPHADRDGGRTATTDSALAATAEEASPRAARDTLAGADSATDSTLAAPGTGAPRAARDTLAGAEPATDATLPADPTASAPRAARDTISGADPASDTAAAADPQGTAERATGAPRAARDTISGGEPATDIAAGEPPATEAVIGARATHGVDVVGSADLAPEHVAGESTDEHAVRAMATEAMPPLVIENTAEPAAAESPDNVARALMATDAMPPLTDAHPSEPSAPPPAEAATPKAGRAFATGAMQPLAAQAAALTTPSIADPNAARAHASELAPMLAAPTHPSSSAWSRLVSWSRQGPSRVVIAIAAMAIGVLVWKLVASDKPATVIPPTSSSVRPGGSAAPSAPSVPSVAAGSAAAPEAADVAGEPAGSSAPPTDDDAQASAGSADATDEEAIEIDAPSGSAAEAAVEPKAKADAKADTKSNQPHTIYISSYPQGAEVYMNGRRLGMTPFVTKMRGFHQVKLTVEKKGFQTIVRKFKSTDPKTGLRFKLVKSCSGLGCM